MATVYIPPQLRPLTGNLETVQVPGRTVREIVEQLDAQFPGVRERLCDTQGLRPGLAVGIGPQISSLGLLQPVQDADEVHFLPAVGGG